MKQFLKEMGLVCILMLCGAGCTTTSHVIVEPRRTPEYPPPEAVGKLNAAVAVYPAISMGDSATRKMRDMGYEMLVRGLVARGCRVLGEHEFASAHDTKCIVELVECRHDMPEWRKGGLVSLITVVAVRVRDRGVLRDGRLACGTMRAFQGVYRDELGARANDFTVSDVESERGVKGAIENLLRAVQFRDVVTAIAGERASNVVPGGTNGETREEKGNNK